MMPLVEKSIHVAVRAFARQREYVILWLPVFLGLGIGLYFSLHYEPSVIVSVSGPLFLGFVLALLWQGRYSSLVSSAVFYISLLAFVTSFGFACAKVRTMVIDAPMLTEKMSPVEIEGTVRDIDRLEGDSGSRIILEHNVIEDLPAGHTPRFIRIKLRDDGAIKIGDRVKLLAGLNAPSAPVAPGAFDFQRYAYFKQIGAFGFAYRAPEIISGNDSGQIFERWRNILSSRILSVLDDPQGGLVAALMTGERAAISDDSWEAMRKSGLAHMLAISGLHVGLVTGVLFFMVRLLMVLIPGFALHHPIKKYAAFAALCGAVFYTLMVGAPVSTVRALIMTAIVLIAIMLDRQPFSLRLVAIAALAVLIVLPESIWSAGFQMSFAAVTVLIAFYEWFRPHLKVFYKQSGVLRRCALYFLGVAVTSLLASLATAPFVLFHFQQLALLGIFANLLAMPLMAFIVMPLIVLSYFLVPFGGEAFTLTAVSYGVQGILAVAQDVAGLSSAIWTPAVWPSVALVLFTLSGLFFILWQGRLRFVAIIFSVLSFLLIYNYKQQDILISSSGKLNGVRVQERLYVSSRLHDRFSAEIWIRRNGQGDDEKQKWDDLEEIRCDEVGCRLDYKEVIVAFSNHPSSHEDDCRQADIVIANDPVKRACAADIVIDVFDLWRNGAHAVWLDDMRVETVQTERGFRPWTISNRR